jgi:crotonobetainyl-CoA:carnitine CoA-transferase CaiB-like acyl-CoA transferase
MTLPSIAEPKPRPLAGIRVLDFTIMMAGPYCTRFLADLGADVIKIEAPEGDYIRQRAPKRGNHSAYFGHLNAGKRSVVLDLKKPTAVSAVKRLAMQADVVVENFRPGVMARLGLDYAVLQALNPRLIYCSISGFGQTGPDAQRPAYAQIVQAASGYERAFADYQDGNERPANNGIFIADVLGGLFAHAGILAALNQRSADGRGQLVDATLMESMLSLMPYEVQEAQCPQPERRPVYPPLKANDGYLMLAAVSPRNFEALLEGLGFADWRKDPILANDAARQANWKAVMERVGAWTSSRSTAECIATIGGAGVPVTRYSSVGEALQEPQMAHRGSLAEVRDGGGSYLVPNLPFKMSGANVSVRPHVPALGEHTEQVLRELLQMSEQEM